MPTCPLFIERHKPESGVRWPHDYDTDLEWRQWCDVHEWTFGHNKSAMSQKSLLKRTTFEKPVLNYVWEHPCDAAPRQRVQRKRKGMARSPRRQGAKPARRQPRVRYANQPG